VALTDPKVRAVAFLIRTEEGRRTTGITEGEARTAGDPYRFALKSPIDCAIRVRKGAIIMPGRGTAARSGASGSGRRLPTTLSYLAVYRASPLERISMIKRGVRATDAKHVIADLAITQGAALKALNLSQATVNKKAKQGQTLSPDESERVIGLARLVGQLEAIVHGSGNPQGFDATAWMSRWLNEPLAALGGVRPIDLMDTMEGQGVVSTALAQMQSGAYA
jgi:putative toxin-antitoxin system antitoxin component (TIGR02293 family)